MEEHDFLALVKKNASRWNTTSAYRKTDKKSGSSMVLKL
jgi:hypothetical protein